MALPSVQIIISDGNLNLIGGNAANTMIKLGVCTRGEPGILQAFGSQSAMEAALGLGSLAESAAYDLQVAGGPVSCLPVEPSIAGSIGDVTQSGSGDGYIVVSAAPHETIVLLISTGGALGSGKFKYQVGNDGYSAEVTLPAGGDIRIPGTYCVATFAAGTYILGTSYQIDTDGTVTKIGSGPNVTQASSPLDNYNVSIDILVGGAPGTAKASWSLDGYNDSPQFTIPSNGIKVIPDTGLVLEFFDTFVEDDVYSFLTCGPSFSGTDLNDSLDSLQANYLSSAFSLIQVLQGGALESAADAATQAAAVQVAAEGLFNAGADVRALVECPSLGSVATVSGNLAVDSADTDSVIEAAMEDLSADRVAVCAGDEIINCPLSGLSLRRNLNWGLGARLVSVSPSTDGAWAQLGGISGVSAISRDEFQSQGLSDARLTTMRTITGNPGFFLTSVKSMASLGSDFAYLTNGRVVDKVAHVARQWAAPLINSKVPTTQDPNAVQGSVSAAFAAKLNASLTGALLASVVNAVPQDAVNVSAQVDTNHNILADGILPISVSVQPFGYARNIVITIGLAVRV